VDSHPTLHPSPKETREAATASLQQDSTVDLQATIAKLEQDKTKLEQKLRDSTAELQATVAGLQQDKTKLEQKLRDSTAELQATIASTQHDKAKLEQQVSDLEIELQATVDEFLRTDSERKRLADAIEELVRVDIERKQLIKDLQAAKRLADENSRLKSEFLSTMSHELRTPLNAIEGFTGIVLNRIGGTDFNGKTERYLTRIRANSQRLLHLINDFLDLSRIEAGRLELANQPFSPHRLAERWQDEIGILAEKKGLQFELDYDSALPETAYGDEEAISKIALNLLGNAIKFTEQGKVKLTLTRNSDMWDMAVEDTGIGIPPHAREFIFEEFRQADQSSSRKYGGTGLGLAIVQKYARAMGGSVNVKSELGKGSTFTVSLPLKTTR
jgi:signal transduction histidine kinase